MGEQWFSTLLTGALVVLTGLYVWQTGRIAKKTADSADASRDAATASEQAARAAVRSVQLVEAQMRHRFVVQADRHADGGVWFTVYSRGANVWLHGVRLTQGFVKRSDGSRIKIVPCDLDRPHGEIFPAYLARGRSGLSGMSLNWPIPQYRADDTSIFAFMEITFSFSAEDERRVSTIIVENPKNQAHEWNKKRRYFIDKLDDAPESAAPPRA